MKRLKNMDLNKAWQMKDIGLFHVSLFSGRHEVPIVAIS